MLLHSARSFALWLAPELDPEAVRRPIQMRYVVAFAAAMMFAAFIIWDASAGATLPGAPVSNRANAWGW